MPFREAYALSEADIRAVPDKALLRVNVDVPDFVVAGRVRSQRAALRAAVRSLSASDVPDAAALLTRTAGRGQATLSHELLELVRFLRAHAQLGDGYVAVETLADAEALAGELTAALNKREHQARAVRDAAHVRDQAFTLVVETYAEVRRVIGELRRVEGDADEIAPPLHRQVHRLRRRRRRGKRRT
jgi:hypothetical protein